MGLMGCQVAVHIGRKCRCFSLKAARLKRTSPSNFECAFGIALWRLAASLLAGRRAHRCARVVQRADLERANDTATPRKEATARDKEGTAWAAGRMPQPRILLARRCQFGWWRLPSHPFHEVEEALQRSRSLIVTVHGDVVQIKLRNVSLDEEQVSNVVQERLPRNCVHNI